MKLRAITTAFVLAGIAGVAVAGQSPHGGMSAANTTQTGAHPQLRIVRGYAAERIVGLYQNVGHVRPCGTTLPLMTVGQGTFAFNAGGTLTEATRFPPVGINNAFGIPGLVTRTIGLGTWWYNPFTRMHSMHARFELFSNGAYYGYGYIERDMQVSADGDTASGPVQTTLYRVDGSVIVDLCGDATFTRT